MLSHATFVNLNLFRFRFLGPLLLVSLLAHLVLAWLLPCAKFQFSYAYQQLLAEGFLQSKLHLVSSPVSGRDSAFLRPGCGCPG